MFLHPPKKKVAKKQTYEGVTLKLIKNWVAVKGTPEQKKALANLFDDKRAYPTIKSWLLENFKINSAEMMYKDIREANLKEAKKQAQRDRKDTELADTSEASAEAQIAGEIVSVNVVPNGVYE